MKEQKVRFAVVGCGRIGTRHAELILKNKECALVALVDIKDKSLLEVGSVDVPFFNSLEAFLQSGIQTDAVCIATPNGFHAQQAMMVLNAGYHAVVEKPMTLRTEDARVLNDTSVNTGKQIFVVMQNRYSPPITWLKELVESGRLGKLYLVQASCFWNRDGRYYTGNDWHGTRDLDGGTLFTQFSHFIDIIYWLFGDIRNIDTELFDFNHTGLTEFEDSGISRFDFVNGGKGVLNFTTSVWDKNIESSLTIIAEKGSVRIGGQYMNRIEYCHVKEYTLPALADAHKQNEYGTHAGSAQNHDLVIKNVVDVLKNRGSVTTSGIEGAKVVDIIERLYKAASPFQKPGNP